MLYLTIMIIQSQLRNTLWKSGTKLKKYKSAHSSCSVAESPKWFLQSTLRDQQPLKVGWPEIQRRMMFLPNDRTQNQESQALYGKYTSLCYHSWLADPEMKEISCWSTTRWRITWLWIFQMKIYLANKLTCKKSTASECATSGYQLFEIKLF